jgi:hypothetical protein
MTTSNPRHEPPKAGDVSNGTSICSKRLSVGFGVTGPYRNDDRSDVRRFESFDEFSWIEFQSDCQFQNVMECQIAPTPLNLTDEGPMQATVVGEALLAFAEFLPPGSDTDAELLGGGG